MPAAVTRLMTTSVALRRVTAALQTGDFSIGTFGEDYFGTDTPILPNGLHQVEVGVALMRFSRTNMALALEKFPVTSPLPNAPNLRYEAVC